MLHYSDASSREGIGDIGLIGGLAWLLWQGGVIVDVVDHYGIGSGLRVYRKEKMEGEHNK